MKFSVIIPAYKSEPFITDTLMSVLNQDYNKEDYEVIVVDDCSPDNQNDKILALKEQHINLRLLKHEVNKRQGGARNTALREAQGEWVFFLDSDDCWLHDEVLQRFAKLIENNPDLDIIRVGSYKSISQTFNKRNQEPTCLIKDVTILAPGADILAQKSFDYIIWNSCYSKSLLIKNNIYFRENVSYEDSDWSTIVNYHSRKTAIVDGLFYGYRQTDDSTTRNATLKTFQDNVASVFAIERFLANASLTDAQKRGCRQRVKKSLLSFIKISRYYRPKDSIKVLSPLKGQSFMQTNLYDWNNKIEKCQFLLLKYIPEVTVLGVSVLYWIKKKSRCLRLF